MDANKIQDLIAACHYAAEGYENLVSKVLPHQRKYLRNPESIAKHDQEADYAAEQAKILRGAKDLLQSLCERLEKAQGAIDYVLANFRDGSAVWLASAVGPLHPKPIDPELLELMKLGERK